MFFEYYQASQNHLPHLLSLLISFLSVAVLALKISTSEFEVAESDVAAKLKFNHDNCSKCE